MAIYTHNEVVGSPTTPWFYLAIGPIGTVSASEIVLANSDGTVTRWLSQAGDLAVDPDTGVPSGTVSSMTRTSSDGAQVFETITGISLSATSLFNSSSNADATALIFAGVDTLNGFSGSDVLLGRAQGDTYNGAGGTDFVSYEFSASGVTADLGTPGNNTGEAAGDVYNSIEGLIGSGQSDRLVGNGGDNTLDGRAGNDTLVGGAGNDTLQGGDGFDTADYSTTTIGHTFNLDADGDGLATGTDIGTDVLSGIEQIIGGSGIDTLEVWGTKAFTYNLAGTSIEIVSGTDAGDQIDGTAVTGGLTLTGRGGNDTMSGGSAGDAINGGDDNDSLYGNGGADTIDGGAGVDFLDGGQGDDVLNAGDGADAVYGADGADQINTDAGNDYAFGGAGDDTMDGSTGTDYLVGDDNVSSNTGATGKDSLFGGADNDTLIGGYDSDNLDGGDGDDALYGDFDDVNSASNPGSDDTLTGGAGRDFMFGGGGNDIVDGGEGGNTLIGGSGNDTLIGGTGSDSYYGQAGTDTFVFGDAWGTDGVWDFADGSEVLDLQAVTGLDSFAQLTITDKTSGALSYADVEFGGNHIFVVGVTAAQLTDSDFLL